MAHGYLDVLDDHHPDQIFLDLLFLDPPYEKGLAAPALERLAERGWTSASTLAVVETEREQTLQPVGWNIEGERIYGAARLSFLRCH